MKRRSSLRNSIRHVDDIIVRRGKRVYIINKKRPRNKVST